MTDINLVKQLKWQCRRGMLELDVILIPFLEEHFEGLNPGLQKAFVELLKEADPDIYTWIMGFGTCDNQALVEIIGLIRIKMAIA